MPVTYDVDSNYLTNPPSHYPRVKPIDTLSLDDIARQINIHNPNMPVNSILAVLNLFVEEVQFQLTAGNWVKIENFCSFATSITDAVMANPSDPLPAGYKIEVKAKPAAPFKQAIRDAASVSRDGIIAKAPQVSAAMHALYDIQNIVEAGYGLDISGKDIGFDPTDAEQGVFITPDLGSETRETNVTRNKPSNVIVIPSVAVSSPNATACLLAIKTKYTANGQLKTGTATKYIRLPNAKTVGVTSIVFKPYGGSSVTNALSDTAGTYLIRARISNLNEIYLAAKVLTDGVWSDWGTEVLVDEAGGFDVAIGAATISFTILNYDTFFSILNSDGRYVTEMVVASNP